MVKVVRSMPAPESLAIEATKANGSYREPDVIERLRQDFSEKCYICEVKPTDLEVEHLRPHEGGKHPERKYAWDNLFPVCRHCNGIKNQKRYEKDVIDCCIVDPEEFILFRTEDDVLEIKAINNDNYDAVNTAALLDETYNKRNSGIRVHASEVRIARIKDQMRSLYRLLYDYKNGTYNNDKIMELLEVNLSRNSEFAAFKRQYVRSHEKDFPELQKLLA